MPSAATEAPTRESAASEGKLDDLTRSDGGVMPLLTEVLSIIEGTPAGVVRVERLTYAIRTALLHARGEAYLDGAHRAKLEVRRAIGL